MLTSNRCVHTIFSIKDRIAQSVERWSNKPLVRGSSPLVITSFARISVRVLDVAFVAERLRRYVQVVVIFDGVGSSPTECNTFFVFFVGPRLLSIELGGGFVACTFVSAVGVQTTLTNIHTLVTPIARDKCTHKKLSRQSLPRQADKKRLWRYRDSSPGQADHNRLC